MDKRNFSIFLTNLTEYTNGNLVGEWVELPCTAEEMQDQFRHLGIGSGTEYFITDYDVPAFLGNGNLSEHENLDELNYLALRMKELDDTQWEKLSEFLASGMDSCHSAADYINLTEPENLQKFDLVRAEDDYDLGKLLCEGLEEQINSIRLPGNVDLSVYIDYEQIGSDACINLNYMKGDNCYVRLNDYIEDVYKDVPQEHSIIPGKQEAEKMQDKAKTEMQREGR